MGCKALLMGPLFNIIEGLQIRNILFFKNVMLANEIRPIPVNRAIEHAGCTLSRATEQTEVSREAQSRQRSNGLNG